MHFLDFEKVVADLEAKVDELRHLANNGDINIAEEIHKLQTKADKHLTSLYASLTPWQKVLVARHPDRPKFAFYQKNLFTNFVPLAGDRLFGEDAAIMAGLATFEGRSVMVIGQEKGHDTASRVHHNFGMPRPEGYRKAQRLMRLAERFQIPIITFIDTAGAYPGVDAEERGQAEAIARSIDVSLDVKVPLISLIIGEGCSGGAIAIAAANFVYMLEHSTYSVISPEGCASILWRSASKASDAAAAQRLTAQDLYQWKIIDGIIKEPIGGAHRFPNNMIEPVRLVLQQSLQACDAIADIREHRATKFG